MGVEYRPRDIFNDIDQLNVIAQQNNTLGVMGRGFALQIKKRFPEVDQAQRELYKQGGQQLGVVQIIQTHIPHLSIANLYAQSSVTRIPGKTNTNYTALWNCLKTLKEQVPVGQVLGMPQIGAGLGGGRWESIAEMLERIFNDRTVYVYIV